MKQHHKDMIGDLAAFAALLIVLALCAMALIAFTDPVLI